jgi:hypothetical protein
MHIYPLSVCLHLTISGPFSGKTDIIISHSYSYRADGALLISC